MTNREQLKEIMREHQLTRKQAAELMLVSPFTVNQWLLPPESKGHRGMSDTALKLLELRVMLNR